MLLMGIILVCSQAFAVDPVHFVFTSNTGDSYSVLILSAKIDDEDLTVGDEIGVFTPDGLCAGAVVWEGATAGLAAWVDDSQTPGVIDGFRAGEEISFKVWDGSADQELEATASYIEGDGIYGTGAGAVVNLTASTFPPGQMFSISGDIVYYANPATGVPDCQLNVSGDASTFISTGVAGSYELSGLTSGTYTIMPSKSGEIGSAISAFDAALVLQYAVGALSFTSDQKMAGDVTGNERVTAFDASMILRRVVNLIDAFPSGKDWAFAPESRMYLLLNTDQTEQNYLGMVYGDVSGNWSPGGGSRPVGTGARRIYLSDATEEGGATILPVTLDDAEGVLSAELVMEYDSDRMRVVDVQKGEITSGYEMAYNAEGDRIRIALAGAYACEGRGNLARIRLEMTGEAGELQIAEALLNEGRIPVRIIERKPEIPRGYSLSQNYPNPFNPQTTITYEVTKTIAVHLSIYTLTGRRIRTLVDGERRVGSHSVVWDGRDESGWDVASGVYLCWMIAGDYSEVRKMLLMK